MASELTKRELLNEEHRLIIDEYYVNGFNGVKAVQKHRPSVTYGSAGVIFNRIFNDKANKRYVAEKKAAMRSTVALKHENILHELLHWLKSDATDYLGLTPSQLRELPSEVKRCIQSVSHKRTEHKDGSITEYTQVKLVDKLKALDMINKHLDFYNADNQSKKSTIDLTNATTEQLNTVLELMEGQLQSKEEDIIDLDG